jgi:Xaa-Pro aminopeptidase
MSTRVAVAGTARADRLASLLPEKELDCLLVTNLVNVRYLCGFTGTNGACIVTPEDRLFLTDFRYVEQAEEQVQGFERLVVEREVLGDVAAHLKGRAGFDDAHLSVSGHRKLSERVGEGVELVPAGGLVERLREVKDEEEIAAIAEAARLADSVYEDLVERGLVGRTEREVARGLERELRDRGAEPAFPVIVAAGPRGARPHAVPSELEIQPDTFVVVDMGAELDGYHSDCTRTLATGDVGEEATEVYELVRSAQEVGLAAVEAGAGCRAVDAAARERIEAAGEGERFGHGLGHGVGLEVHEGPRLSSKVEEGELLRAGNVVTVEPGVYLPGRFGVRIEDLVVVRDGGAEVLTGFSKSLLNVA